MQKNYMMLLSMSKRISGACLSLLVLAHYYRIICQTVAKLVKDFGFLSGFLYPAKRQGATTKKLIFKSHFCNYWCDGMAIWNTYIIESILIVKRKISRRMKSESQRQYYCVTVYLTLQRHLMNQRISHGGERITSQQLS